MKGFKNSTRVQYMKGGSCEGYAKGGGVKGAAKISKVMGEFKSGTLHSGSKSGPEVTNPRQAVAIAMSEARKAGAKMPMKKADGGMVAATAAKSGAQLGATAAKPQPNPAATATINRYAAAMNRADPNAAKRGADLAANYRQEAVAARAANPAAARTADAAVRAKAQSDLAAKQASGLAAMQAKARAKMAARAAGTSQAAPTAALAKKRGGMVEGTSARPTKNGRVASDYELGIGNDDAGAVARGNREPYERMPKAMPDSKPRSVTVERTTVSEAPARQSDLSRRLSRPVPASEMAKAKGKGSFRNVPLIGGALDALGLKYGGMATMPKGKKR
jgi:hypothetical protein